MTQLLAESSVFAELYVILRRNGNENLYKTFAFLQTGPQKPQLSVREGSRADLRPAPSVGGANFWARKEKKIKLNPDVQILGKYISVKYRRSEFC